MSKAQDFLIAFEECQGNIHEACQEVGLRRSEVMNFARNNPQFAERLWEIYQGVIDLVESTLIKMSLTGNPQMIKTFLDAKAKDRGYGSSEVVNRMVIPGIDIPEKKTDQIVFKEEVSTWTTEKIESMLKQIKPIKVK